MKINKYFGTQKSKIFLSIKMYIHLHVHTFLYTNLQSEFSVKSKSILLFKTENRLSVFVFCDEFELWFSATKCVHTAVYELK